MSKLTSAKDKYEYATLFDEYRYKKGDRMAAVRDTLLWEPVTIKVTFYTGESGVWLIHHVEEGFEFAHEAFERGIEWVDDVEPDGIALAEWKNGLAAERSA